MRVAVLGCGYIGLELTRMLAADSHDVWGVRRSDGGLDVVEATGAEAVRADVTDTDSLGAVPDVDHIVFAASSGDRGADAAWVISVGGLRTAINQFAARGSSPERLVYTPNTGVYGDRDDDFIGESTPLDLMADKTRILVEAERVTHEYAAERGTEGTVTRLAELYNPDYHRLECYLNGPVTMGYLSMVHRDDIAGVVTPLLETNRARGDTVLVVGGEPVSKCGFTDRLVDEYGIPHPEKHMRGERFDADDLLAAARHRILVSKRCSNDYLHGLGYSPAYPTYREGYQATIDAHRAGGD